MGGGPESLQRERKRRENQGGMRRARVGDAECPMPPNQLLLPARLFTHHSFTAVTSSPLAVLDLISAPKPSSCVDPPLMRAYARRRCQLRTY